MIDPEARRDRTLTPEQQMWELYATNPAPPGTAHGDSDIAIEARKAEIEEENDPATVPLDFPNRGR